MKKVLPHALVLMALLALPMAGCSKKQTVDTEDDSGVSEVTNEDISSGRADSDSENAMGLRTIYFPFDSSDIVGSEKESIMNNVRIMKENSSLRVQIEGHCDERGGIQYNLALGERRAAAVARAMIAGGVAKDRIATISMGKEKPVAFGSNEDAWAKNRRGNFVITEK
ncbi:MAG: OmpA family protein [Bdellovibrionales bacterium]|nr:OmpA family protein [Bdellovibrionales bacterium]